MRISDWSSDVCSSDLVAEQARRFAEAFDRILDQLGIIPVAGLHRQQLLQHLGLEIADLALHVDVAELVAFTLLHHIGDDEVLLVARQLGHRRSEEHTSELQSLMHTSYAVFCLKKNKIINSTHTYNLNTEE